LIDARVDPSVPSERHHGPAQPQPGEALLAPGAEQQPVQAVDARL
jgi:hypothetical protein